jgi:hypothetical protein
LVVPAQWYRGLADPLAVDLNPVGAAKVFDEYTASVAFRDLHVAAAVAAMSPDNLGSVLECAHQIVGLLSVAGICGASIGLSSPAVGLGLVSEDVGKLSETQPSRESALLIVRPALCKGPVRGLGAFRVACAEQGARSGCGRRGIPGRPHCVGLR